MKKFVRLAILICLLALGACKPSAPPPPTVFSPPDNSFTVLMQGVPTLKTMGPNPSSKFKGGIHYKSLASGNSFEVGRLDFEELRFNHMSDNLDMVRDLFVKGSKGSLTGEETIRIDGNTGRELFVANPTGSNTHIRFFLVDTRIYWVGVESSKGANPSSPEIIAFLDSFHINGV